MSEPHVHTPFTDIRDNAMRLTGSLNDYDELLAMAEHKQFVLLGEATHGTQEFYRMRADITKRLINELNFDAVIIEGDWPDVCRINRHVRGHGSDGTAEQALSDFTRFPRWMWRNREVLEFVQWLREYNTGHDAAAKAGVYGLDLYSLFRSAEAVIAYLDVVDAEAAKFARARYACMDDHGNAQHYGYSVAMGIKKACEDEVVAQLLDLMRMRADVLATDGLLAEDEQFFAERNASVVKNAEAYYRGMFSARVNTWNLRDRHMAETLFALHRHLTRQRGVSARIIVWAHNSHLGDARATDAARRGELNLGQLVREQAGADCVLVGFTTYTGYVTAARDWDAPAEHRWVRPALRDSVEHLFERAKLDRFFLPLNRPREDTLRERMLERAIGVVYRPESERASHYFSVSLAEQFDAVFHLDETCALEPLDMTDTWSRRETPETYPFGV